MTDQVRVHSECNAFGYSTMATAVLDPEGILQVTARFATVYGGDQVIGYQCTVIEARLNDVLVTDPERARRLAARAGIPEPPPMTWTGEGSEAKPPAGDDSPRDARELSRHRYEQALARVEAALTAGCPPGNPDLLNEMRIVRMVGMTRAPWYGMIIDPEDSSVSVGVMMRNAFEAVGDSVDYPTDKGLETRARHHFTRRYLPLWRRGKKEYGEWLDTLGLPGGEAP